MPTIKQELRAFSRVRLDRERTDLDQDDLAYGLNVDLFLEPGSIRPRRGIDQLFAGSLGSAIRRIARVDGRRYQVAGTTAYRDQVPVVTGLDSTTLVTSIEAYRPLNDDTTSAFLADASGMKRITGSTVYTWGLSAPANQPLVYGSAAGSLTGDYSVKTTEIRFVGTAVVAESSPSAASNTGAFTAQNISVYDIANPIDAQVNGIGIYRTIAGGSAYYLEARLNTSTDTEWADTYRWEPSQLQGEDGLILHWTYEVAYGGSYYESTTTTAPDSTDDNEGNGGRATYAWEKALYCTTMTHTWDYNADAADSSLGTEVEEDSTPPTGGYLSRPFQERLWLCQDPDYPHYLYWSKRFKPEAWPAANYLELSTPDDPIQAFQPFNAVGIAVTKRTKYRITGTSAGTYVAQECPSTRGTPAWMTVQAGEDGVYFAAKDGIFKTTGFSTDEELSETIRPLFEGEAKHGLLAINWDAAALFSLAIFQGRLYFAYADTSSTTPNMMAVLRLGTNRWQFYQYPGEVGTSSLSHEQDTGKLLMGGHDGRVHEIETGSDDNGAGIAMVADSKDFGPVTADTPTGILGRHIFHATKHDVEPPAGGTISADVYVDGALVRTEALTTTRRPVPLRLPTTAQGYRWRMRYRYTGTGTARIYGFGMVAFPMGEGDAQ